MVGELDCLRNRIGSIDKAAHDLHFLAVLQPPVPGDSC